jgi:ABC-2 type transport system ATP-binding protein
VTAALTAAGLAKRYGRRWALRDCTLEIPAGRIVGLVGPNGAGKTTLLHLAAGLLSPTAGQIEVMGGRPGDGAEQLATTGFLAQDAPTYSSLTVADHLRMGRHLNPRWDTAFADERVAEIGLDHKQRSGKLSGGQRAQLALTLALAKRPDVLLLDEPVASLDPLARRDFLRTLTSYVADNDVTVVLSSHLIADLERVCDYLVLLAAARVQIAEDVDTLLASHRRLVGPRHDVERLPSGQQVVMESHTERQSTLFVRTTDPIHDPAWQVEEVSVEDIVLAYMGGTAEPVSSRPQLGVLR